MTVRDEILTLRTGRRVGYRMYGADVPPRLLYLHGRPGSRAEVQLYEEDLLVRRGLCAVAVDRPGYGLSDPMDDLNSLSRAADAVAVLEHLDLRQVTVQGMSGGGTPALATAAIAKERVIGLILTSAGSRLDAEWSLDGVPPEIRAELVRERDDKPAARADAERLAEQMLADPVGAWGQLTSHWPAAEREFLARNGNVLIEDTVEAFRLGGLGYFVDNLASWEPWPTELLEVPVPVCVFHGEGDQWAGIAAVRRSLQPLPQATWTTYDGDHGSPWVTSERQEAMLDAVG